MLEIRRKSIVGRVPKATNNKNGHHSNATTTTANIAHGGDNGDNGRRANVAAHFGDNCQRRAAFIDPTSFLIDWQDYVDAHMTRNETKRFPSRRATTLEFWDACHRRGRRGIFSRAEIYFSRYLIYSGYICSCASYDFTILAPVRLVLYLHNN